jgi:signal transduction histidine kinase
MINTMLMISKTEAGVEPIARENVELAGLVRNACELFRPVAEDKGLGLSCNVSGPGPVSGDPRMIQRLLANLLDNAIKYTPPGGKVNVAVAEDEKKAVRVTVQDTGVGIAPNDLPRLFERFYRCDQSRSEPGIGLGLSLARAIARAHGGDIAVTSQPNQGSAFTVTFPKSGPSGPNPPAAKA